LVPKFGAVVRIAAVRTGNRYVVRRVSMVGVCGSSSGLVEDVFDDTIILTASVNPSFSSSLFLYPSATTLDVYLQR